MKKALFVVLVALLYGCAPSMVASKKAPDYSGTISKLSVLIADPGEMKSSAGSGALRYAAGSRAANAISNTKSALQGHLVPYLNANGVSSEYVENLDSAKGAAESSHILVVVPTSVSATCYGGSCQATVRIVASLRDVRSKAIVWTAAFDVPEASSFSHIDEDSANKVGALIVKALRTDNLLSENK